jgi:glucose-6-phosphate isomerase
MPDVERRARQAMGAFSDGIRSGSADGRYRQERFTDVVNIGIGGSDLGPVMATLALAPYHDGPRLHFVSNIDGAHIADTLKLDPETTLVIVASKTFTTIETMTNAATARALDRRRARRRRRRPSISRRLDRARQGRGLRHRQRTVFGFWDWVGGRYSIWSAIGLPLMIADRPENFGKFLAGAHAMDNHFRKAPLAQNLPVLLGLIGFYHRNDLRLSAARHPAL